MHTYIYIYIYIYIYKKREILGISNDTTGNKEPVTTENNFTFEYDNLISGYRNVENNFTFEYDNLISGYRNVEMLFMCGITIELIVVVLEVLATMKWKPFQRIPT